jgi:hypothetical protein
MADNAPVVSEFGEGSCTCNGDYTGCAPCATASTLIRYQKPIPRFADGHSNVRALGSSMGVRHRAIAGVRHGLSLAGICSPPHSGTNWCAYCVYLELKARGLPVGYVKLTDTQILNHLKAGHTLITPGLYARVPLVSKTSYSASTPAKGRSDSLFTGWHMVAAHGVTMSGTVPVNVIITDSDFGSSSRPVVPSHSLWTWAVFLRFYHAAGWGITYVNAKPPTSPTPPPPPTSYKAVIPAGNYFRYLLDPNNKDIVIDRETLHTTGFSADCSPEDEKYWPSERRRVRLVQLRSSARAGIWIGSSYSNQP